MAEIRDGWRELCGRLGNERDDVIHLWGRTSYEKRCVEDDISQGLHTNCIKALNHAFKQTTLAKFTVAMTAVKFAFPKFANEDPLRRFKIGPSMVKKSGKLANKNMWRWLIKVRHSVLRSTPKANLST